MTHTEPPDLRKVSIRFPDGRETTFQATTITVGTSPACDVSLPDAKHLAPQHARFRRMGDRWSIECTGGEELFVGNAPPGRMHWITPGDQIRLSSTGPLLVFHPKVEERSFTKPQVPTTSPPSPTTGYSLSPVTTDRDDSPFAGEDLHLTGIRLPQKTRSGPGLFALLSPGIAALGIVGLVMWMNKPKVPIPPPVAPVADATPGNVFVPTQPPVNPNPVPIANPDVPRPIDARGVHWLGVKLENGSVYVMATCWAYRANRIVMPNIPAEKVKKMEFYLYPTHDPGNPIRVLDVQVHPRYLNAKNATEKLQFDIAVGHLETPLKDFEKCASLKALQQLRVGNPVRWVAHDGMSEPGQPPQSFDQTAPPQQFEKTLTLQSSEQNLFGLQPLFKLQGELPKLGRGPVFDNAGNVIGTLIVGGRVVPVDRLNDFEPGNPVVR